MLQDVALLRLLQLASPALPIGAFVYSQGMEYAVQAQWVDNEESAGEWIAGVMQNNVASLDVPVLGRLYHAWLAENVDDVVFWTRYLQASREANELLREDTKLGAALARLLRDLQVGDSAFATMRPSLATVFSFAAVHWHIPLAAAAQGYLWMWLENQVAAAVKLVPLGQTAGQRIVGRIAEEIPRMVKRGLALEDEEIGAATMGFAMASARHEIQYCRLFQS